MSLCVLIVDDDPAQRRLLEAMVNSLGHKCLTAENGDQALQQLSRHKDAISLVLLDLVMPERDGMSVLEEMTKLGYRMPVIVQTGNSGLDTITSVMRAGAFDFVVKPVSLERLTVSINNALHMTSLEKEVSLHTRISENALTLSDLVASAPRMQRAIELAKRAAESVAPVHLSGESGVGKEVFARAIHGASKRSAQPFVTVNCAAIPKELVESILFGHEQGAFTGADKAQKGKFREAHNGTLFLDEIGELPLEAQGKLLRVLQESEVDPVGGNQPVKVNVRILTATNRELVDEISHGTFREDLYYRISVFPIAIPSLRHRIEDIAELSRLFVSRISAREQWPAKSISLDAIKLLAKQEWPGNVRQLENTIHRAMLLCDERELGVVHIDAALGMMTSRNLEAQLNAVSPPNTKQDNIASIPVAPIPKEANLRTREIDPSSPFIGKPIADNADWPKQEMLHPPSRIANETGTLSVLDAQGRVRPFADIEREILEAALETCDGNLSKAAKDLKLGRSTLYRKLGDAALAS